MLSLVARRRVRNHGILLATLLAACLGAASLASAVTPIQRKSPLELKAFFKPELYISTRNATVDSVLPQLSNRESWESFLAKRGPLQVYLDGRSGAVTNLLESVPLVPGHGVGNRLKNIRKVDERAVDAALRAHLETRRDVLGIDLSQLGASRVTKINSELWQVNIPQVVGGVPVRDGRLVGTISHGNLILLGTELWGDVRGVDTRASLSSAQALEAGFAHADGRANGDLIVREPRLEIIPFAPQELQDGEAFAGAVGQGYGHRLAWTFEFRRPPEDARWEVVVDAHDGEVLAFQDRNSYARRTITGGVYPLTNTDVCPNPDQCGIMQLDWPMPFADTGFPAPNDFTNSAGLYRYSGGTATTTLSGRYVKITDTCGNISNSSPTGTIKLGGTPGQHDCDSGGGSPGNTPAARTAFYQINKIAEMARGYLPGNAWLGAQLTATVNVNLSCSGLWNGTGISFGRSGSGCRNLGEIAGALDHEWGHGLDDNDANGQISNSSEGYADIAAIYRLEASCVGHGALQAGNFGCGTASDGSGPNVDEGQVGPNHCTTDCSGVRDADWAKHVPNTPDTALGFVCSSCSASSGPCGRQPHCASAPARQAAWDLVTRDLTAAPFGMDSQTAFITGNRLFYLGSGNIGLWHACTCGVSSDGCGATNAYMQWLAADDDDGNIANGTPHMTAIHAAYDRHGIACNNPPPQNDACGPAGATTLSGIAENNTAVLSWTAVAGATGYWVYRSEGHAGCNFGKTKIGDVTGLNFTDLGVTKNRTYSYNVVAHGPAQSCFGPVSNCLQLTPQAPGVESDVAE
jgi:hypothetical protein